MSFFENPHRRYNPLTGEWVLVSPHRTKRPWQGKVEPAAPVTSVMHDSSCYLCPGNRRAGGKENPGYSDTYVFINDYSALLEEIPSADINDGELFQSVSERGICKVICFSPRHDLTIALMAKNAIRKVIDTWIAEFLSIGSNDFINYVQIFENRGEIMGASNPHPHGQIWANEHIPYIPSMEDRKQKRHYEKNGITLLEEYLEKELEKRDRLIFENNSFVALVPFWAVWPYETMILPRRHMSGIDEMTAEERDDLADALKSMTVKFDNVFKTSFPYSMGIHQRPTDGKNYDYWQFHIHFLPPLLRSATVKKFMVGYELLANPQRDITAEKSAGILRQQSEMYYRETL